MSFGREFVAIENEVWFDAKVLEHANAGESVRDVAWSWVAEDDFSSTTVGSTMEPDIGIDTESLAGIGRDVDRARGVFEEREKALNAHGGRRTESQIELSADGVWFLFHVLLSACDGDRGCLVGNGRGKRYQS